MQAALAVREGAQPPPEGQEQCGDHDQQQGGLCGSVSQRGGVSIMISVEDLNINDS